MKTIITIVSPFIASLVIVLIAYFFATFDRHQLTFLFIIGIVFIGIPVFFLILYLFEKQDSNNS